MAMDKMVISRLIDAPRELVWKTWTEPERIKKWWGPRNFSAPHANIDLRKGGTYLYAMKAPEGEPFKGALMWSGGKIVEIEEGRKLVLTDYFSNEKGEIVEPAAFGMDPNFPKESTYTVTFEDEDGKTRLSIIYELPASEAGKEAVRKSGAEAGWNESIDKFEEAVQS